MSVARTLLLLRHGQTTYNAARRIQGQIDAPLSETGLAQASAIAPVVAAYAPRVLWASDLQRAAVTADAVGAAAGLDARRDPRLREFGLGEREGITHEEYARAWPEEYECFMTGRWSAVPGAETLVAVRARVEECLSELAEALAPAECGVAVAHGAALRVAVQALAAGTHSEPSALAGMENCAYALLRERPRRAPEDPRWMLAGYNLRA